MTASGKKFHHHLLTKHLNARLLDKIIQILYLMLSTFILPFLSISLFLIDKPKPSSHSTEPIVGVSECFGFVFHPLLNFHLRANFLKKIREVKSSHGRGTL